MDEDIQYWLRLADLDMASAEVLHHAGQELNAIFHLQQVVEKTLKALLTKRTLSLPPRTHDLLKLGELCRLALSAEQSELLEVLSEFYIESRYPESWGETPPETSAEKTARLMGSTKELLGWLRQQL